MFREQRRVVMKLIEEAKSNYFHEKLSSADQSAAFKTVKGLLKPDTGKQLPVARSDQHLAESFSSFFAEKVQKIRESLQHTVQPTNPFPQEVGSGIHLTSFAEVTPDCIRSIIKKSPTKSCALDPIPTWFLKDSNILEDILPQATAYINASLASSHVPEYHKTALVNPLLKKDGLDVNEFKNYRPVSNIPFVSKILEKIVVKQLVAHRKQHV